VRPPPALDPRTWVRPGALGYVAPRPDVATPVPQRRDACGEVAPDHSATCGTPAPKPRAPRTREVARREPGVDTLPGAILAVARNLAQPFHRADLAVACWRQYPERFGLRGHNLPDSNKVFCKLPGLTRRGWLRWKAPCTYTTTGRRGTP